MPITGTRHKGDSGEEQRIRLFRNDFLERTTWHAGQHTRQMMMILESFVGIMPRDPLGPDLWKDLPMPEMVWDDEKLII